MHKQLVADMLFKMAAIDVMGQQFEHVPISLQIVSIIYFVMRITKIGKDNENQKECSRLELKMSNTNCFTYL